MIEVRETKNIKKHTYEIPFTKKILAAYDNVYLKYGTLSLAGFMQTLLSGAQPELKILICSILGIASFSSIVTVRFGVETVYAYCRTRINYEKYGRLRDEYIIKMSSSRYCIRRGFQMAIREITSKDKNLLNQYLEICKRNNFNPFNSDGFFPG